MMTLNIDRIFKARGITKPFSYLTHAGFSDQFASKVANKRVARLNLRELERLCILLYCTPNDLYEWIPDEESPVAEDHPICQIKKSDKSFDMTKALNSLPLKEIEEIHEIIRERLR